MHEDGPMGKVVVIKMSRVHITGGMNVPNKAYDYLQFEF